MSESFDELMSGLERELVERYPTSPPMGDYETFVWIRDKIGEWAWGKLVQLGTFKQINKSLGFEYVNSFILRLKKNRSVLQVYWSIAVACLGKEEISKRLRGLK